MYRRCVVRTASAAASSLMFAVSAHAQNSVTLYGIADTGLLYLSKTLNMATGGDGGKFVGLQNAGIAPSLFGLRGTEDLGGGLQAEFNLQSGIDLTNGGFNNSNGNLFGRLAYVGLKGTFGEVKAGLQFSPFFQSIWDLDPRAFSEFGSIVGIYANNVTATGAFNSNAISYTSPVVAGLQASAMLGFGGVAGNFQSGRQYSASLRYQWSGLTLSAAFYDGNPGGTVNTVPPTNVGFEGRMLAAAYKFGPVTAKASFTSFKVEGGPSNNVYGGGLDFFALPQLDLNGGVWYVSDRNDTSSHSMMGALGATYFLSKTTGLYAQVGIVNNHGKANLGLTPAVGLTSLFAPTGTTTGATIGIMHMF
ncbi:MULTISPECIES: porin [Paraburkholderia]|uniref:Porin n=1 Tax=Paraburkholderia dipogonis TaxID=1211383 RepID=A0A4Y8MGW1_9BURK|nr:MULTISPECIES: porin [Paraburkholderia]RKR31342.1 putative porin [Paraburkholderia sp. BL17N1]TFE36692.1 porin [Paraburkholderia dipogonis]